MTPFCQTTASATSTARGRALPRTNERHNVGEYARRKSDGAEVKIGTCENMYYLRADQVRQVEAIPNSLDPNDPETQRSIRFRFPWPDEDGRLPGEYDSDFDRAIAAPGATAPLDVDHGTVQFIAQAGYNVCLPCPESRDADWLRLLKPDGPTPVAIHRNGFPGAVLLVQQKRLADGRLVPVCRCGGCGYPYRIEEPAEIEALALSFRKEADSREQMGKRHGTGEADRKFWDAIADRVLEGAGIMAEVA